MVGVIKENISYKYFFTPAEREENARKLADAQIGKMELEDEKKAVTSEYKAKIDGKDSEIKLISRHIIDGYTTRTKYALKRKNFDAKVWEWVDEDTGDVLKTEPLMPKDLQQDIPFEPKKEGFDPETGEVFNAVPKSDVVEPQAEDLDNGHESVITDEGLGYFRGLPNAEARELPSGETGEPADQSDNDDTNEGADFDADSYEPDNDQPAGKGKGKGPKKPKK